jgi:vancomycin resistance protein YoaR
MPFRRLILFILALVLLGAFLWAIVHVNKQVEIASFSTSLEGRTPEEIQNLGIAADKVDGFIIKPGEVFSLNEIVGERLRSSGFRGAPTIYQGKVVSTPGGGLCQFSSTLYNAALLSGMEIIERTPHLWAINSVGPGRDATVLYDKLDLKLKNPYEFPLKISIEIKNKRIITRIFGPQKPDYDVFVNVQILQTYPAPRYPNFSHDNSVDPVTVHPEGKEGYKVKVYRIFRKDGKPERKEIVSSDRYEPVPGKL